MNTNNLEMPWMTKRAFLSVEVETPKKISVDAQGVSDKLDSLTGRIERLNQNLNALGEHTKGIKHIDTRPFEQLIAQVTPAQRMITGTVGALGGGILGHYIAETLEADKLTKLITALGLGTAGGLVGYNIDRLSKKAVKLPSMSQLSNAGKAVTGFSSGATKLLASILGLSVTGAAALSLAGKPEAAKAITDRVMYPVKKSLSQAVGETVASAGDGVTKAIDKSVKGLVAKKNDLNAVAKDMADPAGAIVNDFVNNVGTGIGRAVMKHSIPVLGGLTGAGIGGLSGGMLGDMFWKDNKRLSEDERDRRAQYRRSIAYILAGLGGGAGVIASYKYSDPIMKYLKDKI